MTQDAVDKLKRMMEDTGLIERGWNDFKRYADFKGSAATERFARDVFIAGAFRMWGLAMYELTRLPEDVHAATIRSIEVEFARFVRERIDVMMKSGNKRRSIEDWP